MPHQHPKPFSSEWLNAPTPAPERPHRLRRSINDHVLAFFGRFPGERPLAVLTVLALVLGSFWFGGPNASGGDAVESSLVAQVPDAPQIQFADPRPTVEADISTESLQVTDDGESAEVPELNLQPVPVEENPLTPGGVLPQNRILSFYGFPENPDMGILGQYDMQRLLELMREQAAVYEQADPTLPVILAFEVIASVAQQQPQEDGSYLLDTPSEMLNEYADFTRENGMLLILDAQIGYRTVENDVVGLRPWLAQDHVHLAIDPEFAMDEGQVPGKQIGSIDATDIQWAQQWLVDLAVEESISPKILIVHQFTEGMITNKDQVIPLRGVQLVIDADGWGPPDQKRVTYDVVNKQMPIEYAGIKLFYEQDGPLMTPEDVLALDPVPLFVMYQ